MIENLTYIDKRKHNKGRPSKPVDQKRKLHAFSLTPTAFAQLKAMSGHFGSQSNVVIAALEKLYTGK